MTFLERTGQSPKGTIEFLRVLQQRGAHADRPARSLSVDPSADARPHRAPSRRRRRARPTPTRRTRRNSSTMHHRIVAKLMGFITPDVALQRFAEADRSVPARYARAIALVPQGRAGLGAARHRRPAQGISQRSLLPRGARPDAVRERPRRRSGARPTAAPSSFCRARRSSRSTLPAPCSKPTSRTTTARRCATSSWPRSRSPAPSTCGA